MFQIFMNILIVFQHHSETSQVYFLHMRIVQTLFSQILVLHLVHIRSVKSRFPTCAYVHICLPFNVIFCHSAWSILHIFDRRMLSLANTTSSSYTKINIYVASLDVCLDFLKTEKKFSKDQRMIQL